MRTLLNTFLLAYALGQGAASATMPDTVYITKTGECYHAYSCPTVRKGHIAVSRSEAVSQGYRACQRCKP